MKIVIALSVLIVFGNYIWTFSGKHWPLPEGGHRETTISYDPPEIHNPLIVAIPTFNQITQSRPNTMTLLDVAAEFDGLRIVGQFPVMDGYDWVSVFADLKRSYRTDDQIVSANSTVLKLSDNSNEFRIDLQHPKVAGRFDLEVTAVLIPHDEASDNKTVTYWTQTVELKK